MLSLVAVEDDAVHLDVARQHLRDAFDVVVVDMSDDEKVYHPFQGLVDILLDGRFV